MTFENAEAYYFEEDEFGNPENIKSILSGLGEETNKSESLKEYAIETLEQLGLEADHISDESFYALDEEGDVEAGFYKLDQGILITCNSEYLSENSRSIPSRSTKALNQ